MASSKPFVTDIENIRKRAREHIDKGAITAGYSADRETVIKLLNEALATEIVCVLRYKYHYYMAKGIHAKSVAAEFLEHANEEQVHADRIAERITQLDGTPNFSPEGLASRSHADYVEGDDLVDMIKEDLVAERIAIDSYREIINFIGASDSTTRRHDGRNPRDGRRARGRSCDAAGQPGQEGRARQGQGGARTRHQALTRVIPRRHWRVGNSYRHQETRHADSGQRPPGTCDSQCRVRHARLGRIAGQCRDGLVGARRRCCRHHRRSPRRSSSSARRTADSGTKKRRLRGRRFGSCESAIRPSGRPGSA